MYSRSTNSIIAATLALLMMGAPTTSLAAPPAKADCSGPDIEDVFDRLACKQAAIAEQMTYTSDEVFKEGTKLHQSLSPAHIKQVKNAKAKATRAKKKNNKAFFKRQAKSEARGNKQTGHLVPYDDVIDDENQDGICDYEQEGVGLGTDAQCAAIELKADGTPEVCNPQKKNKGKGKGNNPKFEGFECDRATDFEEAASPEEAEDIDEAAEQLAATYEVTEDNLIEMNQVLDVVNETEPAPAFTMAGGCVIPSSNPDLFHASIILRQVQTSTFGVARLMADVMGQTGLGFNARAGAAAFDTIATLAKIAFNTVDDLRQEQSAALQTAIMDCVVQSANEIAALRAQVSELKTVMQQEHSGIMANDDENTARIIELLNTPQGQRPQFPVK